MEQGYDMIICHEGIFWGSDREILARMERADTPDKACPVAEIQPAWDAKRIKWEKAWQKKRFIEESGLVVLRIHDVWDRKPDTGIPWAWAQYLGLGHAPILIGSADRNQHRYDIQPMTLDALVLKLAQKTALLGEPILQVFGDPNSMVSRIGIGTGCGTNIFHFVEMGCDTALVCDDHWTSRCFADIAFAIDIGYPVIRVNHGTSEEPGMLSLTAHLARVFPDLRVQHLPHGCCFRLVGTTNNTANNK